MSVLTIPDAPLNYNPPRLTQYQLEEFLAKVKWWHKTGAQLNHINFELDEINFVRSHGYTFSMVKGRASHFCVEKS